MTNSKFDADPDALAWARGKAQSLVDKARKFETDAAAKGDTEGARTWRVAANMADSHLIGGTGCVIAAFDERLPQISAAMKEND